jgi:hypothetical protein
MGRRVIRAGESNYFRGYKKLEVFAKLATTYDYKFVSNHQPFLKLPVFGSVRWNYGAIISARAA